MLIKALALLVLTIVFTSVCAYRIGPAVIVLSALIVMAARRWA